MNGLFEMIGKKFFTTHSKLDKIMSVLTDIQADVQAIGSSFTTIVNDLQKISAGLPAVGGLSEADTAALKASLDTVVTQGQSAAAAADEAAAAIVPAPTTTNS